MFSAKEGWSDRPLDLACGQCIGCRVERSRQWALRCVHEASLHARSSFVTLTYDQANLPSDGSVNVKHWQDFAKRLRKAVGPFRFFHVGEYGDESFRPHYHALLFGVGFDADRVPYRSNGGAALFRSPLLERTWGMGLCPIGDVSFQSAAYVARYCLKKVTGGLASVRYRRVDAETGEEFFVRPEYVTMSRRPGIGAGWFEKFGSDVYPDDEVVHDGKRFRPPKFYDGLLERESPEVLESVRDKRARAVAARKADLSYERLRAKEQIALSRVSRLKRNQ